MVYLKTNEEIKIMRRAGQIAALAMEEVSKKIQPGVSLLDLDKIAEEVIRRKGAESSFKKVEDYKFTICATPNNWVVHGIPGKQVLKEGYVVGVDLGAFYQGFHSDMAKTFPVGKVTPEIKRFLSEGEKALEKAVKEVRIGNYTGNISFVIQSVVEQSGYSVVREFVGHGVGRQLHEDPLVPGYGEKDTGTEIKEGMVLAVEIIYNQGKRGVHLLSDGWTAATTDKSTAGLFELTVAATKKGPLVLTRA